MMVGKLKLLSFWEDWEGEENETMKTIRRLFLK